MVVPEEEAKKIASTYQEGYLAGKKAGVELGYQMGRVAMLKELKKEFEFKKKIDGEG